MRMTALLTGWALVLTAAALIIAGIVAAAPSNPDSAMSALGQVMAQQWELARGFQHMLLGFVALLAAFAAFILVRQLPNPAAEPPDDLHGNIHRMAIALEAMRRESPRRP